jgi:hypothetical protein
VRREIVSFHVGENEEKVIRPVLVGYPRAAAHDPAPEENMTM